MTRLLGNKKQFRYLLNFFKIQSLPLTNIKLRFDNLNHLPFITQLPAVRLFN